MLENNIVKEMWLQLKDFIDKSTELHELIIEKYSINIENIINNITTNKKEEIERKILFSIINILEYLLLFSEAFTDWNNKNNKETVYEIFIFSNILYSIGGCLESIFYSLEKLKLISEKNFCDFKLNLNKLYLMEIRKVVTHSTHVKMDNNIEYYLFRNPLNTDELNIIPSFIYKLSDKKIEKVYFKMDFVIETILKFKLFLEDIKNILNKYEY